MKTSSLCEPHFLIVIVRRLQFLINLGLEITDHLLSGKQKKLIFVSVWFAYTVALFFLNRFEHWATSSISCHRYLRQNQDRGVTAKVD